MLKDINIDKKEMTNTEKNGNISIEIDELTPCLTRARDNKQVETYIKSGTPPSELLKDWEFDWAEEENKGYNITQLFAVGDSRIQGLIATKPIKEWLAVKVDLVEAAPFNNPHNKLFKKKEYIGVGGHLFAEAVSQSLKEGFNGFVVFKSKTNLINHYKKELNAKRLNKTQLMYIDEEGAKVLYERYNGKK